jgi:hypothetical protein
VLLFLPSSPPGCPNPLHCRAAAAEEEEEEEEEEKEQSVINKN